MLLAGTVAVSQSPAPSSTVRVDDAIDDVARLRESAAAGSATAMLELGFRADRGQGQPRDPKAAFAWYLQAAQAGLAEAQLNVGIMLDAGVGTERDPYSAVIWYTRAALRGNARAQFNLGLLYDAGIDVPQNRPMSSYWFSAAQDKVPAAADKIAPPGAMVFGERLTGPVPIYENVTAEEAEIIWRSEPQPEDSYYLLQIYTLTTGPIPAFRLITSVRTQSSGVLLPLSATQDTLIWRIIAVDDVLHDYAASNWRGLPLGHLPPRGGAVLATMRRTPQSAAFVDLLQSDLRLAGIAVDDVTELTTVAEQSRVIFRYRNDRALAMDVAGLLTSDEGDATAYAPDADLSPGQVGIALVMGPDAEQP